MVVDVVVGPGARVVVGATVCEVWYEVVGATVVKVVVTAGTVPGTGTVFDGLPWLAGLPAGARVPGVGVVPGASLVGEPTVVVADESGTAASVAIGGIVNRSLSPLDENVRTDTTTSAVDTTARYAIRAGLNRPIERTSPSLRTTSRRRRATAGVR